MSEEIDGVSRIHPTLDEIQFVFTDDRVTYWTNQRPTEGTYRLEPARSPRALDVMLDDIVMNFIYELTDTRLRLCFTKGGPRPEGFDTAKEPVATTPFVLEKR